jgi:hypothetical protein
MASSTPSVLGLVLGGHPFAHPGNQRSDSFPQLLVRGAGFLGQSPVGGAKFLRQALHPFVGVRHFRRQIVDAGRRFVELALGIPPKLVVCFPVFSPLLVQPCREVLNSLEPLFGGHEISLRAATRSSKA